MAHTWVCRNLLLKRGVCAQDAAQKALLSPPVGTASGGVNMDEWKRRRCVFLWRIPLSLLYTPDSPPTHTNCDTRLLFGAPALLQLHVLVAQPGPAGRQ